MAEPPEALPAKLAPDEEGVDILLAEVGPELPAIAEGVEMG